LAELRWILLALGIVAIGAIWWGSVRRTRQAPGNAELRESTVTSVQAAAVPDPMPAVEKRAPPGESREWSVSPLEPLSIRTADFEQVPALDQPMLAHSEPLRMASTPSPSPPLAPSPPSVRPAPATAAAAASAPVTLSASAPVTAHPSAPAAEPAPAPTPPVAAAVTAPVPASTTGSALRRAAPSPAPSAASAPRLRPAGEHSDRLATVTPQAPNASEQQKILTLRVCAVGDARWSGAALMNTLEMHGLAYGRYQVYHRQHNDGRSIFYVASLIEPGSFDIARMPEEEFRGVSLFAVLPGPLDPMQTLDALLSTARDLAQELSGAVQDAKGVPFSPQHAAALREDVARFQALLH
jgi:cell division protein ZipA